MLFQTTDISKYIFWDQKIYFEISVVWAELTSTLRKREMTIFPLRVYPILKGFLCSVEQIEGHKVCFSMNTWRKNIAMHPFTLMFIISETA